MTPRQRYARRTFGLAATILLVAALIGGVMVAWLWGTATPMQRAGEVAKTAVALGMAIYACGRWRQLG